MAMFTKIAGLTSACSLTVAFSAADAQTNQYPYSWDTSQAGSPLPASATAGAMTFDDEFTTLNVCADGVSSCNWYAPIRSKLGTGTLAQANNSQAINLSTNALTLNTINPSSSGVGGTDVFMQSIDTHGHGYSMTNGYVEVGISLPAAHGSHAGFFMDEIESSQGHGEIDFPETYGAADTTFSSNVHWWPVSAPEQSPPSGNYWTPAAPQYASWHSYGVLLTATTICTYMDRKEIGCIQRIPQMSNPWYFELTVFTDPNRSDGYQPAQMRVAHVRAWATN